MKQTTLPQNGSSLFNYAISKLSPKIFSHPIWVRFGKKEVSASLKIIDDLFSAIKTLKASDPSAACQVLLLCAVYQNYAGQQVNALKTAREAQSLAERTGLADERVWALWGSSAISLQRGDYEQAASYLLDLQVLLSDQNEWILADFIDVLKRSLFHPSKITVTENPIPKKSRSFIDLTTLTFDWLQQWGYRSYESESEFSIFGTTTDMGKMTQTPFLTERWKRHWHSLSLAFHGEMKFQWNGSHSRSDKKQLSPWKFNFLTLLQSLLSQNNTTKTKKEEEQKTPEISSIIPTEKASFSVAPAYKEKPTLATENTNRYQHDEQAATFTPVAVYMLGAFSLTIGDTTLKLPASRGLSVLKYLLFHHNKNIPREVLMEVFWPDVDPETARNNLNVAIHSLRRVLRSISDISLIEYENGAYGLNPNLQLWLDVEEFERCIKAGRQLRAQDHLTAAVHEHEAAISLYQGDFLEQSLAEEWAIYDRERLRLAYLDTLDRLSQIYFNQERYAQSITICQLILTRDHCREDAHCTLMRCFSRQGQYHLALRQYQICYEALRTELEIEPMPGTTLIYDRVRSHERV